MIPGAHSGYSLNFCAELLTEANIHSLMLSERQQARRLDPERTAHHAQHVAQAGAVLVESQRRK